MKYDRKDKTKIIVLATVLVAVWVVIGIRFAVLSAKHKASLARSQSARAGAPQTPSPATPAAPGTSPALRLAALVAPVAPPTRDPFRPLIASRSSVVSAVQEPTSQRRRSSTETPAVTLPPMPGSESAPRTGDRLQLTGIIQGTPSTAVLRLGDDHFVVKEGDVLDSSLRVQKITSTTVVLRDGRSSYTLRIGG
ncbi:MAG: hypothetical protein ACE149_04985 [Armatimonadota bacterium]